MQDVGAAADNISQTPFDQHTSPSTDCCRSSESECSFVTSYSFFLNWKSNLWVIPSKLRQIFPDTDSYLPCSQRWGWRGHCSWSHTPGIEPTSYRDPPWSHSRENCRKTQKNIISFRCFFVVYVFRFHFWWTWYFQVENVTMKVWKWKWKCVSAWHPSHHTSDHI